MIQCKEPGCRAPATRNWKGRKVCDDHYDEYRDHYAEEMLELMD